MKIANQFTVGAPVEQAWDVLCDLERVIPLMPGAQLAGRDGDDYLGKVKIKVGPVTSEFTGKVRFVEQDRGQFRAVIDAKGKEARGTGNAAATVTAQLQEAGERTSVSVDTDLKIAGKLAQFGSSMLQQVSEKLLGQFVESLEAELAGPGPVSDEAAAGTSEGEEQIPAWPANPVPGTREAPAAEPEPIDLLDLAGGDQLKKYGPPAVAVLTLLAVFWVLRRRR